MLTQKQRQLVLGLIAAIFLFGAVLSEVIAPGQREYIRAALAGRVEDYRDDEGTRSALRGTSFQTLMSTFLGIREVLASMMWVQADEYFHKGEYRPILQMVRTITRIDPHQLDVYATGAWHMAYNFMDKRLIEDGVSFLEDGCKNNDTVYDLFFERGYMHYDKTKNFEQAVTAYREATKRGTTTGKPVAPAYVRHQLAHAMEKMGDIDLAVSQWETNLRQSEEEEKGRILRIGPAGANTDAARHNLYITKRRRNERLAALAERGHNQAEALRLWQGNVELAKARLKEEPGRKDIGLDLRVAETQVARLQKGEFRVVQPLDLKFHYTITRVAPRKLEIAGTINVLDLSRVHVRFQDKDYNTRAHATNDEARDFDFKMANCSLEWDALPVKQGKFSKVMNLDIDPADMGRSASEIYPLKADQFEIVLTYNPRLQAAFIQDLYGWNGEGLTASPDYLVVDEQHSGRLEGKVFPLRMAQKVITISRDDVVGSGKKVVAKG
jgi:tetratricopeptide (TPR) repeat protein